MLSAAAGRRLPPRESGLDPVGIAVREQNLESVYRSVDGFQLDEVTRPPAGGYRTLGHTDLPNTAVFESYKAAAIDHLTDGEAQGKLHPVAVPGATGKRGPGLGGGGFGGEQKGYSDQQGDNSERLHGDTLGRLYL